MPADSIDVVKEYNILLHELKKYNSDLLDKEKLLVITKLDIIDEKIKQKISRNINIDHVFISSVNRQGLTKLKDSIWHLLNK